MVEENRGGYDIGSEAIESSLEGGQSCRTFLTFNYPYESFKSCHG